MDDKEPCAIKQAEQKAEDTPSNHDRESEPFPKNPFCCRGASLGNSGAGERRHLENLSRPVAPVTGLAKVRERALWRANLALNLGELVRHADQEFTITLALVGGEGQDAGQVATLL